MSQNETKRQVWDESVAKFDEMIRSGQINDVSNIVAAMNFAQIPRSHRQALAKIARRCGMIEEGLEILYPVIRNEKPLEVPPSAGEICEYSVLLSRNGSIKEALSLLAAVDAAKAPEALLYQGFCHISDWDYAGARVHLERYLDTNVDPYSKLIARVNLGACYVVLGERADAFIEETLQLAMQNKANRLVGNCHELLAQFYIGTGDFGRASHELDRANDVFGGAKSYDQLLIEKWRALIEASKTKSATPLRHFRDVAKVRQHWEFVRDADLLALKLEFDQRAFDHLIFGTPNETYRERIRALLPVEPSSSYVWGSEGGNVLDLDTGRFGERSLNTGKKIHQTIATLIKDFYAPRGIGNLFSELYPEERFNVHTSNMKVRQLLSRTREWFSENEIPLVIEYENRGYRLLPIDSFGIRMRLERESFNSDQYRESELVSTFRRGETFTASQACEVLQISKSSLHRLVESLVGEGKIVRIGTGKATKYRVAS